MASPFGGFAVFHCPLKDDSGPALRMLKVTLLAQPPGSPQWLCPANMVIVQLARQGPLSVCCACSGSMCRLTPDSSQ